MHPRLTERIGAPIVEEKSWSIRYSMLMAGIRGKSGPPANQNAFKHGLAGINVSQSKSVAVKQGCAPVMQMRPHCKCPISFR